MKHDLNLDNDFYEGITDILEPTREQVTAFVVSYIRQFKGGMEKILASNEAVSAAMESALAAALPSGRDWESWIEGNVLIPAYRLIEGDVGDDVLNSIDGLDPRLRQEAEDIGRNAIASLKKGTP